MGNYTLDFSKVGLRDMVRVGGKNASLGELHNSLKPNGVNVPDGFATTADAFRRFLAGNDLEAKLTAILSDFDPQNTGELQKRGNSAPAA